MLHLSLRTEYSFKRCYGRVANVLSSVSGPAIGVADDSNTFAHVKLQKHCDELGIKPIFGVRLEVVASAKLKPKGGQRGIYHIFIAKNNEGLKEIYELVSMAYENYYYRPLIGGMELMKAYDSDNVAVIAEGAIEMTSMGLLNTEFCDYIALGPHTNKKMLDASFNLPLIAVDQNDYISPMDKSAYEVVCDDRTRDIKTTPQHILTEFEYLKIHGTAGLGAIRSANALASECSARIPRADPVKFKGDYTLDELCKKRAKEKGIDLNKEPYAGRYKYEMGLIKDKDFADYFLIVAKIVNDAKKTMLVGPARGSSSGSLVTYVAGITEIDPIKHGLLFERFIDINRPDMPDIDIDFPDRKREVVIRQIVEEYGKDKVCHISTVSKLKPRSALSEVAAKLCVPSRDVEEVKDAIVKRSGGDARAELGIEDTFKTVDVGKKFIEKYPNMRLASKVESHARHSGVHAAGIIISNEDVNTYGAVDRREGENKIMMEYKDAESVNLLKMDILGLRTLSVLEDCASLAGFNFKILYDLDLKDPKVYEIFQSGRLHDIFQFSGYALKSVAKQMKSTKFDDIVAITALSRPGPLHSGGTNLYIDRFNGNEPVRYLSDHPAVISATKETYGVIIFQEQLMRIAREYGKMTWYEVSRLRKAAGKSLGEEYFNKYRDSFLKGTRSEGISDEEAIHVWENMVTFGSWGFNKSHAVAYAMLSYWTAWAKTYHPLEFVVANLNNSRDEESSVRILRDAVENDGIDYCPVDPIRSGVNWAIVDGVVMGGLTNIKGIGAAMAKDIVRIRDSNGKPTNSVIKKLTNPETPYDVLFPCKSYFGDLYEHPEDYDLDEPPTLIKDIQDEPGNYVFIGRLIRKNTRDKNEYQDIVSRGYEITDEPTQFINITLEDDTDSILCQISRWKYDAIGRQIAEEGIEGKDWYIVSGKLPDSGWRFIFIDDIIKLNDW